VVSGIVKPMIDLRKLEIFLKVYETRSFSKASKLLHLAQPTITLHIKDLEEALGISLLDRNTRRVLPSKPGKVVYNYGIQIISLVKQMEKELEFFKAKDKGFVEIGGSTIPGQYILPKVIKAFREKNPGASVFLKVGDSKEVFEKVLTGDVDIGVVGAIYNNKEIICKPCYEDEIVLIAPPEFEKEEVEIEELYEIDLIKREPGSGTWKTVVEELDKMGFDLLKLKIVAEMGSTEAIKEAVKAGLGCGFVSALAVEVETSLKMLKIVKIKDLSIKRKFYLIRLKNKKLLPMEEKFVEFLKDFLS